MPRKPRRNIPPSGRPYGERQALIQTQQAIPAAQPQPQLPPTQVVPLHEPTMRPDEPVTAGLPFGPGPGPEALGPTGFLGIGDESELEIGELIRRYPQYTSDLKRLLDYYRA